MGRGTGPYLAAFLRHPAAWRREPQGHRGARPALYNQEILPAVLRGERTLVAAHGNLLRALVMVFDRLTPRTIPGMELATGVPLVHRLKADSTVESNQVLEA